MSELDLELERKKITTIKRRDYIRRKKEFMGKLLKEANPDLNDDAIKIMVTDFISKEAKALKDAKNEVKKEAKRAKQAKLDEENPNRKKIAPRRKNIPLDKNGRKVRAPDTPTMVKYRTVQSNCPKCNALIIPSNMNRHMRTKKCKENADLNECLKRNQDENILVENNI